MKNLNIKRIITGLLIATLTTNLFAGIEKINDDLYVGKKGDLYFALEHVTSKNSDFWLHYGSEQLKIAEEKLAETGSVLYEMHYGKEKYTEEDNKKAQSQFDKEQDTVDAVRPFILMIKKYKETDDVWIAYATPKKITTESINIPLKEGDIEMSLTATTDQRIPFSSHMGIFRSLNYKEKIHNNLSMNVHSFAAQAILAAYKNKDYMITRPLRTMAKIFKENLPEEALWLNKDKPTVTLSKDKKQTTIVKSNGEKVIFDTPKFFTSGYLMHGQDMHIIDLKALANFMKLD